MPEMRRRVEHRNRIMLEAGAMVLNVDAYRDIWDQSRLFRQSRTRAQILLRMQRYNRDGYSWLAHAMDEVGPQQGKLGQHATNAGPGESWHQYGLAQDACPILRGELLWDYDQRQQEVADLWEVFGDACRDSDLVWAGNWAHMREMPHAQMPMSNASPLEVLDVDEIRARAVEMGWV
jgi:peptidoglycan L-alanyl-D-glutamate endopeptidase CwlK